MRHLIESYGARVVSWSEPTDDMGGVVFSVLYRGRLIVAECATLLLNELQSASQRPLLLMAA